MGCNFSAAARNSKGAAAQQPATTAVAPIAMVHSGPESVEIEAAEAVASWEKISDGNHQQIALHSRSGPVPQPGQVDPRGSSCSSWHQPSSHHPFPLGVNSGGSGPLPQLHGGAVMREWQGASGHLSRSSVQGDPFGPQHPRPGDEVVMFERLGSTTSNRGRVFTGHWHKAPAAIKVMYTHENPRQAAAQVLEMAVLSSVRHPTVVRVYSVMTDMVEAPAIGGEGPNTGDHLAFLTSFGRAASGHHSVSCTTAVSSAGSFSSSKTRQGLRCYRRLRDDEDPRGLQTCNIMVLEYCDRGTLRSALDAGMLCRPLPEGSSDASGPTSVDVAMAARLLLDVASALNHLHNMHLVHGDVRAENVFLKSDATASPLGMVAKLGNFSSCQMQDKMGRPLGLALPGDDDDSPWGDGSGALGHMAAGEPGAVQGNDAPAVPQSGAGGSQRGLGTSLGAVPDLGPASCGAPVDAAAPPCADPASMVCAIRPVEPDEASSTPTMADDVHAFGTLIWQVVTRHPASYEYGGACKENPDLSGRPPCDRACSRLANRCWAPDPAQRPAMAEVEEILERMLLPCSHGGGTSRFVKL